MTVSSQAMPNTVFHTSLETGAGVQPSEDSEHGLHGVPDGGWQDCVHIQTHQWFCSVSYLKFIKYII